jgi:hypothetical protein
MKRLEWRIEPRERTWWIGLEGDLTEHADLGALAHAVREARPIEPPLRIDVAGIRRLSSSGVQQWIRFLTWLADERIDVVLERCSVSMVQQLCQIKQFRVHAHIRSAMAPYYCPACNVEQLREIDIAADLRGQLGRPETCQRCGGAMEFDEFDETFAQLR